MTYKINISQSKQELLDSLAESFVRHITAVFSTKKQCRIVLGGGKTPVELNRLIVKKYHQLGCNWKGLHIYFSDERMVPNGHPDHTATMIRNTLTKHLDLPMEQIHSIPTSMDAHQSADVYNQRLIALEKSLADGPMFQLSLLGLGPDGHTASLFPNSSSLMEQERFVVHGGRGPEGLERVSLTFPAIDNSALVWIVAAGGKKQSAVNQLINGPYDPNQCPAQGIKHEKRQVTLWLDKKCINTRDNETR